MGKYVELMGEFFDLLTSDKIKLRIMFTQNRYVPTGLSAEQRVFCVMSNATDSEHIVTVVNRPTMTSANREDSIGNSSVKVQRQPEWIASSRRRICVPPSTTSATGASG